MDDQVVGFNSWCLVQPPHVFMNIMLLSVEMDKDNFFKYFYKFIMIWILYLQKRSGMDLRLRAVTVIQCLHLFFGGTSDVFATSISVLDSFMSLVRVSLILKLS